MSVALAAAGGTLALPRMLTSALLPRVLGIYIAGCAGFVQLLDIMVDRLHLDDRIFTFAIVLAVIGIPFAAAGAVLADTSRAEKRRPGLARTGAPVAPRADVDATVRPQHGSTSDEAEKLRRRLELVLSYRRIAELHEASGDDAAAGPHAHAWRAEALRLADDLRRIAADPTAG